MTPRQVRRWKERGWLETNDRRITEKCLGQFLRAHPDCIPFNGLPREDQVYLFSLGFPSREAATFKKNVREILDGIGRQRNPRRPVRRGDSAAVDVDRDEEDGDGDDGSTLTCGDFCLRHERATDSMPEIALPTSKSSHGSLLFKVCVRSLSPFLK